MIEIDNIYNEDCLEGMKLIPDGTIDAVICDLPYGTTHNTWDEVIPFDLLWAEYHRICKKGAPIVLFGSEPFSSVMRMSNIKEYRYDWIWKKSQGADFLNVKRRPLKNFETISVFCRKCAPYNPQGLRQCHRIKDNASKFGNNSRDWNHADTYVQEWENYPQAIIEFDNPTGADKFHPTQKPVDLLRYLILTYTNEGDTILDNCMGSGTTAIACIKEKRHFIGFEIDKKYYDIANERIYNETRQLTIF